MTENPQADMWFLRYQELKVVVEKIRVVLSDTSEFAPLKRKITERHALEEINRILRAISI